MIYNVKELNVSIDKKNILTDINLTVSKGQFVGIVGANGSGKSTLLKAMCKSLPYKEGTIYFNGKELQEWRVRDIAKENAVVSQVNDMQFDFTVLEMVLMGREPHKEWWQSETEDDARIAMGALKNVLLEGYADKKFSRLSGGEKQRVLLARALAQEADCLILDEPTNHLDVANQISFMNLVRRLPLTVIAVIHDLNLAANYCDYIYALKSGRLITSGKPDSVFTVDNIKTIFDVSVDVCQIREQLQIVYLLEEVDNITLQ
ncbi:ABC transporter ATP-binding protein [Vagococcus intermedius]|uniref:ABC transporter ATP-binding protein n=1 Tax=Vagococcus intermedius TaxID=2991418 RepID=UPI0023B83912|nr:ABC transporter ATP-binding protein [Vagococcus intermedius]WEG75099.1 ABC transporter ATP-binding protein [Vagococcus intermedius]